MPATDIDVRARLSWMWVFVLLNMIFADIFGFMYPGFLDDVMTGHAGSVTITPGFLLIAAIVTEIPIAMVVLTQVLPQRLARWTNIIAGVLTIVYIHGGGSGAPHYIFISVLETLGCLYIAWTAWKWYGGSERISDTGHTEKQTAQQQDP